MSGRLYTWGFGESGQLANASGSAAGSPDENAPFAVPTASGALAGTAGVVGVGVGGQHTVVIAGGVGPALDKALAAHASVVEDPPKDDEDGSSGDDGEGGGGSDDGDGASGGDDAEEEDDMKQ